MGRHAFTFPPTTEKSFDQILQGCGPRVQQWRFDHLAAINSIGFPTSRRLPPIWRQKGWASSLRSSCRHPGDRPRKSASTPAPGSMPTNMATRLGAVGREPGCNWASARLAGGPAKGLRVCRGARHPHVLTRPPTILRTWAWKALPKFAIEPRHRRPNGVPNISF